MNQVFSSALIEKQLLSRLPFWTVKQGELNRVIVFDSQSEKCVFINRVFSFAEQHHHHPTLWINHLEIRIRLFTHDSNGITEKDFVLAEEINNFLKK